MFGSASHKPLVMYSFKRRLKHSALPHERGDRLNASDINKPAASVKCCAYYCVIAIKYFKCVVKIVWTY